MCVHNNIEQTIAFPLNIQYLWTMDHYYANHTVRFQNVISKSNIFFNGRHKYVHLFHNAEFFTYILQWITIEYLLLELIRKSCRTVALLKHFPTSEKKTTSGSFESNNSATSVSQTSWNSFKVETIFVNVFKSCSGRDKTYHHKFINEQKFLTWL